jgi:uncharacterized cupin superfamily protein
MWGRRRVRPGTVAGAKRTIGAAHLLRNKDERGRIVHAAAGRGDDVDDGAEPLDK